MTTTSLGITSFSRDPVSGEMDCTVTSSSPLYIGNLILIPVVNLPAPLGRVTPGTASHPALRTLSLNSTNAVFSASGAFTLVVTYDGSYNVSDAHI